jgi:DNA polymerase-1
MVIGEAPETTDDNFGKPFQGQSGDALYNMMRKYGFPVHDICVTNIVKCLPSKNSAGMRMKPTPSQRDICTELWLDEEIENCSAPIIITLGSIPLNFFFPHDKISDVHGQVKSWNGRKIVPMYHPAAGMYNPRLKSTIEEDFNRFWDRLAEANVPRAKWKLVTDLMSAEMGSIWREIVEHDTVAFDFETTDLRPHKADVVGIALAWDEGQGVYIDTRNWSKGDLITLYERIATCDVVVAHNAVYEAAIAGHNSINFHDTMMMARTLGKEFLGLKALALSELNVQQQPIEELIGPAGKAQLTMDQVDPLKIAPYAVDDAVSTLRLYRLFKNQMTDTDWKVYNDIDRPLIKPVAAMIKGGFPLDQQAVNSARSKLGTIADTQHDLVLELAGPLLVQGKEPAPTKREPHRTKPVFLAGGRRVGPPKSLSHAKSLEWALNPASASQASALLGTKDAKASTLEALATPLALGIRDYKHLQKLQTSYVENLAKMGTRAYGSFNIVGTDTGRFSASGWKIQGESWGLNMQTLPKAKAWEDKEAAESDLLRACFVSGKNQTLVEMDYSQVELRVLAHIAGDTNLQEAYQQGRDVHEEMMRLSGLSDRRLAKILNFGCTYEPDDSSAAFVVKRTARSQGVVLNDDEARELVYGYRKAWPMVPEYYKTIDQQIRSRGYVETLFGRKLRLQYLKGNSYEIRKINRATLREGVNMPIQGTAADIIKIAWARLWPYHTPSGFISGRFSILNTVHDSLILECPTGTERVTYQYAKGVMESAAKLDVPLVVDGTYGPNWRDQVPF